MTQERFLPASNLAPLVDALVSAGVSVFGPSTSGGRTDYRRVRSADDVDLTAPMPALPLKALFLPPTEPLFSWRRNHHDVTLTPVATAAAPAVVLGARPCDAAALEILDRVMGWDYRDELWFGRREATTIVSLACSTVGPDCFCETVGLGPQSARGADILLLPGRDGYRAQVLTGKGAALVERCAGCFAEADAGGASAGEPAQGARDDRISADLAGVRDWLTSHFDDPFWETLGPRCHGCGACASVCPTCHCFDIVDEPDGLLAGTRRRNWDTCQASKFTVHASGHNPRADQHSRFRQRVMHKFGIYPQRFGEVLCTGCGRCARVCPAGQNLVEILGGVRRAAGAETRP